MYHIICFAKSYKSVSTYLYSSNLICLYLLAMFIPVSVLTQSTQDNSWIKRVKPRHTTM